MDRLKYGTLITPAGNLHNTIIIKSMLFASIVVCGVMQWYSPAMNNFWGELRVGNTSYASLWYLTDFLTHLWLA